MVSLVGLQQTFKVAKNPVPTIFSRFTGHKNKVVLRNGRGFDVDWKTFCFLRDNYGLVEKFQVTHVEGDKFWFMTPYGQLVGNLDLLGVLEEISLGVYDVDFSGKCVLDVGGFMGETAVYFYKACGAKEVVVYEPVADHVEFIRENLELNFVPSRVCNVGVGGLDGEVTVCCDRFDCGFGLYDVGLNEVSFVVRDVAQVIVDSKADVAKFDCEGAEMHLINVADEVLRQFEFVIVEYHSLSIRFALEKKFTCAGFVIDRPCRCVSDTVGLEYFRRV